MSSNTYLKIGASCLVLLFSHLFFLGNDILDTVSFHHHLICRWIFQRQWVSCLELFIRNRHSLRKLVRVLQSDDIISATKAKKVVQEWVWCSCCHFAPPRQKAKKVKGRAYHFLFISSTNRIKVHNLYIVLQDTSRQLHWRGINFNSVFVNAYICPLGNVTIPVAAVKINYWKLETCSS